MGNCLVTKLQESVNNDNLRQLGGIIVTFKDLDENPNIVFYISGSYRVKAKSGKFNILNYETTDVFAANLTDYAGDCNFAFCITPAQANTVVEVTSKYDINGIGYNVAYTADPATNHVVVNASDLNYSNIADIWSDRIGDKTRIRFSGGTVDLATMPNIVNSKAIYLTPATNTDVLKIIVPETLVFGTSLIHFVTYNPQKGSIADMNISSFEHATSLVYMSVPFSPLTKGDIKALFDAQFANGRTSGTLSIEGYRSGLTYDGEQIDWSGHDWFITATFTQSGWTSNY